MDPESAGPIYTAEQIRIPPELPDMLKEFTKAAIRTQPTDILQWSAAYFHALANGEVPPVKDRLEQPLPSMDERLGGLTKGGLAVLHKQAGARQTITLQELTERWRDVGFAQSKLEELCTIGNFENEIEWQKLLALACTALEKTLPDALKVLCEILSPDSEGGPARIPVQQFCSLYSFLAEVDGEISTQQVSTVREWLETESWELASSPGRFVGADHKMAWERGYVGAYFFERTLAATMARSDLESFFIPAVPGSPLTNPLPPPTVC